MVATYSYFPLKQEANLIKFSAVLMIMCGGRVRTTHSVSELWESHGHLGRDLFDNGESGHISLSLSDRH